MTKRATIRAIGNSAGTTIPATLDPATANEKYGWKFFNYTWNGATPGEHTVTSRVTDVDGNVQATAEELEAKLTFLEHSLQLPRRLIIE